MIESSHLSKVYRRGLYALRDLSLTIDKGEFLFLTGPSGLGKSTLLRLLLREELPTEGQLKVFGRNLMDLTASQVQAYRRSLGFVFQDFRLIPRFTVFQNVAFVMRVLGVPLAVQQRKTFQMLKWVGLQHRMNAHPDPRSRTHSPRRSPGNHARARPRGGGGLSVRHALRYAVDEAMASLWRGRQSGLLSTGTIGLALFVLGGFLLTTANLQRLGDEWSRSAEMSVYLNDDARVAQRAAIEALLMPGTVVAGVEYVAKAQALERFKQTLQERPRESTSSRRSFARLRALPTCATTASGSSVWRQLSRLSGSSAYRSQGFSSSRRP